MNGITDGVRPMILCSELYANSLNAQDRAKFYVIELKDQNHNRMFND